MSSKRAKARTYVALQFLLILLLLFNPFESWREVERAIPSTLSLILYVVAAVILASAALALGSALTASPIPKDDATLVMTGIYRWIRHPMYTALLVMGLGLLLGTFNLLSLSSYIALILLLLYKSRYEDQLLASKHPAAKRYQEATGRFIPKIFGSKL